MSYILAKDVNKHGCVALEASLGEDLVKLSNELDQMVFGKGIQIVVISRPTAFGEYAPYKIVSTKEELINAVKKMLIWLKNTSIN